MQVELSNKNDRSENVCYNIPEFPVYVRRGVLSSYPNFSAISHWHDDVEFILVESGNMDYNINGKTVRIKEGEGIFVNSRQLHYGFSKDFGECIFICILVHPVLLCASAYIEQKYVEPVLEHKNMSYLVLHPDKEYEKEILKIIGEIDRCCSGELFAITAQRLFLSIWEKLFLLSGHVEEKTVAGNQQLSILKDMLRFIYQNYDRKISLDQICQAGKVGKTTCCAVFRRYTNETPVSYLTGYRLKKAIRLLETTDKTVSEICFETGFSGASYFTETFHRFCGCTPTEYRISAAYRKEKGKA